MPKCVCRPLKSKGFYTKINGKEGGVEAVKRMINLMGSGSAKWQGAVAVREISTISESISR